MFSKRFTFYPSEQQRRVLNSLKGKYNLSFLLRSALDKVLKEELKEEIEEQE